VTSIIVAKIHIVVSPPPNVYWLVRARYHLITYVDANLNSVESPFYNFLQDSTIPSLESS